MATRVKLELDPETFGRLVESAVGELRSADWQAEVLLRRVLGTWDEPRIGFDPPFPVNRPTRLSTSGRASVRPSSPVLPLEARQAAWRRLWERLLAEPPTPADPETEPAEDEVVDSSTA
jgi:hypothetical protein